MGRKIKFNLEGQVLESEITKVDRKKLYGSSKKIVKDNQGNGCVVSDLYQGSRILPRGSISQVLVDKNGSFVKRSDLVGFNEHDEKVEKVSSIFALENKCRKIDLDEFLSVNVKSIYQLDIADDQLDKWQNLFKNDEVYFLVFNYREDYEGDDAYIISNDSGFFMTVGKKNEFVYLEQENINLEEEEEEIDDELDFSML